MRTGAGVRTGNADQNLAVVRHMAVNMLKQETTAKVGIKAKRKKAGWDEVSCLSMFRAMRRSTERFSAALPYLTLLLSSPNATSKTQWTEFSIPQCVLTLDSSIRASFGRLDM